jgi:transposase
LRKLSSRGVLQAVGHDESVVPASDCKVVQQQLQELQRLLGKKTLENEILKEATEVARQKKWLVRSP